MVEQIETELNSILQGYVNQPINDRTVKQMRGDIIIILEQFIPSDIFDRSRLDENIVIDFDPIQRNSNVSFKQYLRDYMQDMG